MANDVALITGGATGIGAAVASALAQSGVRVAICDVNQQAGRELAQTIGGVYYDCDVRDEQRVEQTFFQCANELGLPRFVHLNAGIMTVPTGEPYLAIEDVSQEQYRRITGVNLDGVFHGLRVALKEMKAADGGAITITASTAGLSVVAVDPLYTATKYAVIGLGRAVAAANEYSNVRINVICPGVVDTAIVPDDYKKPEFGMMPVEVMATEVVDLLRNGANGEVRVKNAQERPAFVIGLPDLNPAA